MKKAFIISILFLCGFFAFEYAYAAIGFDASTDGGIVNPGNSLTFSHTVTSTIGANPLLIVGVFGNTISLDPNGNNITGVTYGGVAMTEINRVATPTDRWAYLFYLLNPATSTNNVVVSANSSIVIAAQAASYTGVQQSGQPDASATSTVIAATSATGTLTTVANNAWTVLFEKNNSGAATAGTGSTLRQSSANGDGIFDSNGPITPAGVTSMNVMTGGIATYGIMMASFSPSAASNPNISPPQTQTMASVSGILNIANATINIKKANLFIK